MHRTWKCAVAVSASAAVLAGGSRGAAEGLGPEQAQVIVEQALEELAASVSDIVEEIRVAGSAGAAAGGAALALAPARKLPGPGGALGPAGGLIGVCASLGNMPGPLGKPRLAAGAYLVVIRRAGKHQWAAYYIGADGKVAASSPAMLMQLEATVPVSAAKVEWEGETLSWSLEFPAAAGDPPLRIASDLLKPAAPASKPQPKEEQPPQPDKPTKKKPKKSKGKKGKKKQGE